MIRIASAAIAFAALASIASAFPVLQVAAPPNPETVGPASVLGDRDPLDVVCRAMRPQTGTRLQGRNRERVCQTQADWDAQAAEAQAATRDAIDGGMVNDKEFLGPGGTSLEGGPH